MILEKLYGAKNKTKGILMFLNYYFQVKKCGINKTRSVRN